MVWLKRFLFYANFAVITPIISAQISQFPNNSTTVGGLSPQGSGTITGSTTAVGTLPTPLVINGPTDWITRDSNSRWYGRDINMGGFDWTTLASSGAAWPEGALGVSIKVPSGLSGAGAGISALTVAATSLSGAFSNSPIGGIRLQVTNGTNNGAVFGYTGEIGDCDRDCKITSAVSNTATYLFNENDMHITSGTTGSGLGFSSPSLNTITQIGSAATAYYVALYDPSYVIGVSTCFPGTTFAAACTQPSYGFQCSPQAATSCLYVGPVLLGNTKDSQSITFNSKFSSGANLIATEWLTTNGVFSWNVPAGGQYAWEVNGTIVSSMNSNGVQTGAGQISNGTKFTTSGCSVSATTGGATSGKYTSGTTGTCTVVITMAGATGITSPNGWTCFVNDQTTPADKQQVISSTTTTATISGTTVSGDVISFGCNGY